jgi:hypothetical protein
MWWSSLVKLLLGVILAIAILMGGGVATALYFMFKVTTPPPKPIFANDKPSLTQHSPDSKTAKSTPLPAKQSSATLNSTDSAKPLEPGAYKARVTWSQGLSLRSEPNLDAERTGSAVYNQLIVVLGESADKNWQRVRLEDGEQEGWIKAGNIQKEEQ